MEYSWGSQPAMSCSQIQLPKTPLHGSDVVGGTNAASIPIITMGHLLSPASLIRRPISVSYEHAVRPNGNGARRTAGLTSFSDMISEGKVVPLGRWCNIRARVTLTALDRS